MTRGVGGHAPGMSLRLLLRPWSASATSAAKVAAAGALLSGFSIRGSS
jgi:hypothetical protein